MVKLVIVKACPAANDVFCTIKSAADVPTVPCIWQVVAVLSWIRKCAAVPVLSALVSCHVPVMDLEPLEALDIQSEGRLSVATTVPLFAAAQLAGAAPVRIVIIALVPIVDSIASNLALRTVVEYCSVTLRLQHLQLHKQYCCYLTK